MVNKNLMKDLMIAGVFLIVGIYLIDFIWVTFEIGSSSTSMFNLTANPDGYDVKAGITTLYTAGVGIYMLKLIVSNILGNKKSGGLMGSA